MFRTGEEKKFLMEQTRQVAAVNALSTENLFLLFSFRRPQCLSASALRTELSQFASVFLFSFRRTVRIRRPDRFENKLPGNPGVSSTGHPRNPRLIRVPSLTHKIETEFELGNNLWPRWRRRSRIDANASH